MIGRKAPPCGSLTVTLPDDIVRDIEARVAAGEDASESNLVRDGLESFLADDQDLEDWLSDVVVPRCEDTAPRSSTASPIEGVLERVQRRFADER